MKSLSSCPVCAFSELKPYLSCKDHTVSHETFQLQKCPTCGFVLTNPRPDERDLPKYYQSENYISHSEKTSGLLNQGYRIARRFTLTWKYKVILHHSIIEPKKLLDYGCGTGSFLAKCQDKNIRVTGVEPSQTARNTVIRNTQAPIFANLDNLNDTFDVITLWHVLEHVPDLHETLEKLKALLEENGTMFIAVPNLQSHDAKIYRENWAAYDVPRHLWHFSRDTMKRLLDTHQLRINTILPMKLDAYYVSLLSEKYAGGLNTLVNITRGIRTAWNANRNARTTADYSSLIYIIRK